MFHTTARRWPWRPPGRYGTSTRPMAASSGFAWSHRYAPSGDMPRAVSPWRHGCRNCRRIRYIVYMLIPICAQFHYAYGDSPYANFSGSVTANIGWYVVPILHDQPSCNIDITWPVESTLWVTFVLISVQICVFPFSCRYYMIGVSCNIDSTWSCSM